MVKFHGTYQQDDRDIRDERRRQKLEPAHQFMIRIRAPGGVFTPEQWLKLDAIATTHANHSLRVTTRQTFQFHGVIKRELKATMQAINAAALDTVSACGDVNRNVLGASNPLQSRLHAEVHAWAGRLSTEFLPTTRAYYEIWLTMGKAGRQRRGGRPDLRQGLPAAQVQDGRGGAAGQRRGHLRQRLRPDRHCRRRRRP